MFRGTLGSVWSMRRSRLVAVGVLAAVAVAVPTVLSVRLLGGEDASPRLSPGELLTVEVRNQPGWLHRSDDPSSDFQGVWVYPTSPTTPYRSPGDSEISRYLLLDPRQQDSEGRAGHDEWWFVIDRYWPSSYEPRRHGKWGREVNFHNVAGDAGAAENDNGGVGWDFGSGVSALALDWLPSHPAPSLCILCASRSEGGADHPLPAPARDRWHTYVIHWIAGRTDGTTVRPGMIEVWVDGADEPYLRRTNLNTVQRARGDVDGKLYTQRWMVLWEGDYTAGLEVEARLRFTLTRIGRTLEEALADRPTVKGTSDNGGFYRVSGDAPKPSVEFVAPRKASASKIPPSLLRSGAAAGQ
jgi:hypothetical protein